MSAPASGAGILLRERFGPRTHRGAFPSRPPALLVLGAHNADGDVSGRSRAPFERLVGWRATRTVGGATNCVKAPPTVLSNRGGCGTFPPA